VTDNAPSLPISVKTILAIDPGRAKCGLAVVSGPEPLQVLFQGIVAVERLIVEVSQTKRRFPQLSLMLVGNGTGSAALRRALQDALPEIALETVEEHGTSLLARRRFVTENPAPGWRRILPPGLRSPERPYDDYVARLLAEQWFLQKKGTF